MKGKWTAGVDFGGTYIKIGLVDARGRVGPSTTIAARGVSRPPVFIAAVARAVETLARQAGTQGKALRGVGVGAPGVIDTARGVVRSCVNVPGWRNIALGPALSRRLGCRCAVDNDANLFGLGEWRFGAGRRVPEMVGLTLGTGVGGALILRGQLYRGAIGSAGEIGHMTVEASGPRCACGNHGCLEAFVGTRAILRAARAAMRRRGSALRRLAAAQPLTPRLVAEAARAGDAGAAQVWRDAGRWLGVGIANLVNVLNPQRVVIGGGVANAWSLFYPSLLRAVREGAMPVPARAVRIVRARLGERAGIVGAAALIWSEPSRKPLNG